MANLTIAVDDELLRRARVRAAEQGTSVNAVLRERLEEFVDPAAGERVAAEFIAFAAKNSGNSGPGGRIWSRDELHTERFER